MKKQLSKTQIVIADVFLLLALSFCSFYLFYHQTQYNESGLFYSDLLLHIKGALSQNSYSLVSLCFQIAYAPFQSYVGIAAFLAIVVDLTAVAGGLVVAYLLKERHNGKVEIGRYIPLGTILLFISSIFVPVIMPGFYSNNSFCTTQPWHNSTFLVMRLIGLVVILEYVDIERNYLERITLKDAALFTLLLILANYAKPNFIIAFAPAMLFYLAIDFCRTRTRSLQQNVKFGVCVLLSLPILLLQVNILYPEGSDSGVAFTLAWLKNDIADPLFLIKLLCSMTFPLVVGISFYIKHIKTRKIYRFGWLMWLISRMECVFLTETGPRATHGNFAWGVMFFSFFYP